VGLVEVGRVVLNKPVSCVLCEHYIELNLQSDTRMGQHMGPNRHMDPSLPLLLLRLQLAEEPLLLALPLASQLLLSGELRPEELLARPWCPEIQLATVFGTS